MMQDNTLSIIAKLLANENINMYRGKTSTAFFDVKNRTLVLPTWQNLTDAANEMLVAHEIGHALFTPQEYSDQIKTLDFDHASSYVNIIEDARIEKLVKQRYPGLRKTFKDGYQHFQEMDLFGTKSKDINQMTLIDRINMFYKAGHNCGVRFTAAEKEFINRIDNVTSFNDVIEIAKAIYEFDLKQTLQNQIMSYDKFNGDPDGFDDDEGRDGDSGSVERDDDYDDYDDDSEDMFDETMSDDQPKGRNSNKSETESDQIANNAPVTNESFAKHLEELADSDTIFTYSVIEKPPYNPIVSYKLILDDAIAAATAAQTNKYFDLVTNSRTKDFMVKTESNVSFLVKEFEMRKAAQSYKRASVAKTGSIDTTKLWGYKIKDDIFRRLTVTKDGQNHGMVFLLDWSGSMEGVIQQTVDQLINLVSFCRRCNIPYRVYAFTDAGRYETFIGKTAQYENWPPRPNHSQLDLVGWSRFMLLEFFSSEMNNTDHLRMIRLFKNNTIRNQHSMHGTPLVAALGYMYHEIETFQKKYNVEKLTFITLSDGCSTILSPHVMIDGELKDSRYFTSRNYIVDPVTKKQVLWKDRSHEQVNAMLDLIKSRYGCKAIGFFVTATNRRALFSAIYDTTGIANYPIDLVKSAFNQNGCYKIPNTSYDELFLIPSTTKIAEPEMGINSTQSSKGIAKQFGKFMNGQKTTRYMLNAFVEQIA